MMLLGQDDRGLWRAPPGVDRIRNRHIRLLTVLSVSVTVKYLIKPIYIVAIFSAAAAAWFMQNSASSSTPT
jgi:hypothetical protein